MTTDEDLVPKTILKPFWDAYIEHAEDAIPDPWLREDLFEVDTNIILDFLSCREHNSYRLARHVTKFNHISTKMCGAVARVKDQAIRMLLTDCEDLSLTYPPASGSVMYELYTNIFAYALAGQDIMDELAMCKAKVDQFSAYTEYHFAIQFHSLIASRCKYVVHVQNKAHKLCSGIDSWRHNMLDFIDTVEMLSWSVHCDIDRSEFEGLTLYRTGEHVQAEKKLRLALKDDSS